MANWYCSSDRHTGIPTWTALTSYNTGNIIRQLASPAEGAERAFVCITGGTTLASEPTWNINQNAITNEAAGPSWQETTGKEIYAWSGAGPRSKLFYNSGWISSPYDNLLFSTGHIETNTALLTWNFSGTPNVPSKAICVNDSLYPEIVLATGANIRNVNGDIAINGFGEMYGLKIHTDLNNSPATTLFTSTNPSILKFTRCRLVINTSTVSNITIGASSLNDNQKVIFDNTVVEFQSIFQTINIRCRFDWINTLSAVQGTMPTKLFTAALNLPPAIVSIVGVDFSNITGNKALVELGRNNSIFNFRNCKIGSGVFLASGTNGGPAGTEATFINCTPNINYGYNKIGHEGNIASNINQYRTNGASDGTTSISYRMITSTGCSSLFPLQSPELLLWNESTGIPQTGVVHFLTDNIVLTNSGIWVDFRYLGDANFPISQSISTRLENSYFGSTGTAYSSGTGVWTSDLSSPRNHQITGVFTPRMKGLIGATLNFARPDITGYLCPKLEVY